MVTALALHPAKRRRLAEQMPEAHGHEVILRPLGGGGVATVILGASEQDFVGAVLADIGQTGWHELLGSRRHNRRGGDGILELSQPVHRRYFLAFYEAVCRRPGSPRVDPRKLSGSGLVFRRRDGGDWQGWMSDGPKRRGWLRITAQDADPDPAQRVRRRVGTAGQIEAMIAARRGSDVLREQVLPLFAAPEDLCKARGRTILYGLIPVASGERSEAEVPAPNYGALPANEAAAMRDHLSGYFKMRPATSLARNGEVLDPGWVPLQIEAAATGDAGKLRSFGLFLQQLLVELDAFGPGGSARELMRLFGSIELPTGKDTLGRVTETTNAADFLAAAAPILVAGAPNSSAIAMPLEWPSVNEALGSRLTATALACLSERFASIVPESPKFDGDSRQYAIRAFTRVDGPAGCPSKLVWSDYSENFRVLPWWDGDGPAAKIPLPDLSDMKRMKPNISFQLPPSLANLLQGDMKKLKDGEDGGGPSFDIFWLCSFSLPIITLCAFIVLNIFLSLFDLIFRWMAFIKICIPIPRPK